MQAPAVIRLKGSGRMATFNSEGRLTGWTDDVHQASLFDTLDEAHAAIRGICAPELRAAIRAGYAAQVEDGETGELYIVDASDRYELFPTPRIRVEDVCPRYLDDDPMRNAVTQRQERGSARRARALVRELFADAPKLNWALQTLPRISPSRVLQDEYHTTANARARRAGALAHYTARGARQLSHVPA